MNIHEVILCLKGGRVELYSDCLKMKKNSFHLAVTSGIITVSVWLSSPHPYVSLSAQTSPLKAHCAIVLSHNKLTTINTIN